MRHALCCLALAAVAGLPVLTARAQVGCPAPPAAGERTGTARVPAGGTLLDTALRFRPSLDAREMVDLSRGGIVRRLDEDASSRPAGKPISFSVRLAWMSQPLRAMLEKSSPRAAVYDRLWLSWSGDR